MATFNPGTGGTLKSTTIESAALELCTLLQSIEQITSRNSSGKNNIQITYDTDAKSASIRVTLPITQTIDSAGKPVFTADSYLQD